jgi:hypothetical protein
MFHFAILDPRNLPAASEANEKVFSSGQVFGIEVTVPSLAARCVYNLDPQHGSEGDANSSAIEAALTVEIPAERATLVTVRADLDSVGAMAIFNIRAKGEGLESAMDRISMVAAADKFARGGYTGPKPLPTRGSPWDDSSAGAESSRPLAAIAAAVADFKIPLGERVATMEKWLLTGEEPGNYRAQVERERADMIAALESGAIRHEVCAGGCIAVVESTHRAATSVGYALAPVVVALNPSFRLGAGEPHRKFTICAFEASKYADIKSALAELATLEPGWGGSPTIGGSPQGVSSTLSVERVVEVLTKYLK